MRIYKLPALMVVLSIVLLGCGKGNNTNTNVDEGAAGGSISVHVSDGDPKSRPIYTWSDGSTDISATTAMQLRVARTSNLNTIIWAVSSLDPSQNAVQSPIQHDTTQAGTTPTGSEIDLSTNITYRVTVTKADNTSGYREFTVLP